MPVVDLNGKPILNRSARHNRHMDVGNTLRTQDPPYLFHRLSIVLNMFENIAADDDVKTCIWDGEVLYVRLKVHVPSLQICGKDLANALRQQRLKPLFWSEV